MRLALFLVPAVALALAPRPSAAADKPAKAAKPAAAQAKPARIIEMAVTQDGFVPAEVKVKKGEPVQLVITRKTDKTCATEIVIKDYGIDMKLPLDQAVTVAFTPRKAGNVRYACGMDMISGVLVVE
jgi:plastocyanin domain-containing protein